jgi:hypothetical protein
VAGALEPFPVVVAGAAPNNIPVAVPADAVAELLKGRSADGSADGAPGVGAMPNTKGAGVDDFLSSTVPFATAGLPNLNPPKLVDGAVLLAAFVNPTNPPKECAGVFPNENPAGATGTALAGLDMGKENPSPALAVPPPAALELSVCDDEMPNADVMLVVLDDDIKVKPPVIAWAAGAATGAANEKPRDVMLPAPCVLALVVALVAAGVVPPLVPLGRGASQAGHTSTVRSFWTKHAGHFHLFIWF